MAEQSVTADNQRRSFRIPVQMDSFVYPIDGSWQGRRSVETIDLSCGEIAFYADSGMEMGDMAEIVLPMTTNPLIVRIKLLRKENVTPERACYAAKFIDLGVEEDQMICEAVFRIQRQNRLVSNAEEREV